MVIAQIRYATAHVTRTDEPGLPRFAFRPYRALVIRRFAEIGAAVAELDPFADCGPVASPSPGRHTSGLRPGLRDTVDLRNLVTLRVARREQ